MAFVDKYVGDLRDDEILTAPRGPVLYRETKLPGVYMQVFSVEVPADERLYMQTVMSDVMIQVYPSEGGEA